MTSFETIGSQPRKGRRYCIRLSKHFENDLHQRQRSVFSKNSQLRLFLLNTESCYCQEKVEKVAYNTEVTHNEKTTFFTYISTIS